MAESVEDFWRAYRASLLPDSRPPEAPPAAWSFGSTPEMADELGGLVRAGVKTGTASLLWAYEAEGEPLPQAGAISLILDSAGQPLCLIETTSVAVKPFTEVDEAHAWSEGEGDRSLRSWREVHWRVFSQECAILGRAPAEDMPVVCERFRLLFTGDQDT